MKFNCTCLIGNSLVGFAKIHSLKVLAAGRNVDDIMMESDFLQPIISNHTASLDLGVVTNTGYGYKSGDYDPLFDDQLVLEAEFHLIDGPMMLSNQVLTYTVTSDFVSTNLTTTDTITLIRNGMEEPVFNMSAQFLGDTNQVFVSG